LVEDMPYHVGVVVPDLEGAITTFTALLGLRWTEVDAASFAIRSCGVSQAYDMRRAFSAGPRPVLELIEVAQDGVWPKRDVAYLHHLGYWSTDLGADAASFEAAGAPVFATRAEDPEPTVFTYHQLGDLMVELVDIGRREHFDAWIRRCSQD
jgi:hypothetical protein